jgi:hypothetical protein
MRMRIRTMIANAWAMRLVFKTRLGKFDNGKMFYITETMFYIMKWGFSELPKRQKCAFCYPISSSNMSINPTQENPRSIEQISKQDLPCPSGHSDAFSHVLDPTHPRYKSLKTKAKPCTPRVPEPP